MMNPTKTTTPAALTTNNANLINNQIKIICALRRPTQVRALHEGHVS
jgi:hypothetical protein